MRPHDELTDALDRLAVELEHCRRRPRPWTLEITPHAMATTIAAVVLFAILCAWALI